MNSNEINDIRTSRREKFLDRIMSLTMDLLFTEDSDAIVEEVGRTVMDLFPIKSMIIYTTHEELNAIVPMGVFGYPPDRAKEIREKVKYEQDDVARFQKIGKPLGRFSEYFPYELFDKDDERVRFTALRRNEIDSLRKEEDDWHPGDTADFTLVNRIGREIGDISITSTKTGKMLDEESVEGLEILASITSVAIELSKLRKVGIELTEAQEKRANQMSQILAITSSLLSLSTDPTKLLERILELIRKLFGFQSAGIALYDDSEGLFRWRALIGYDEEEKERTLNIRIPKEIIEQDLSPEYRIGYLAHFVPAEKVLPEDLKYYFYSEKELKKARSYLEIPREEEDIWHPLDDLNFPIYDRNGKTIGIISPERPIDKKIPSRETIEVMEIFVSLAAIAIDNSKMYTETIGSRDEIFILNRLMFHDLMNYSLAIRGYIELALDADGSNMGDFVKKAIAQIDQTAELINKIKKLSLIRSTDRSKLIRIDLRRTIRMQASKSAVLFPSKVTDFEFALSKEEAFVMANDLLPDLFHNIFTNAIKYDRHEKVRIKISLEKMTDRIGIIDKDFWKVSIIDNGPGIPDNRKDIIFEGSARLSGSGQGMGLGLSIVKSLVELYRGEVSVQDRVKGEYDKGSVFVVKLPVA